jgi:hypothetical protein
VSHDAEENPDFKSLVPNPNVPESVSIFGMYFSAAVRLHRDAYTLKGTLATTSSIRYFASSISILSKNNWHSSMCLPGQFSELMKTFTFEKEAKSGT